MSKLKYTLFSTGIIIPILLIIILFGFFNRSLEKDDGIKYLIGVSLPNLTEPRMIYTYNKIKEEVSNYQTVRAQFFDANNDDIKQKQDAEKMLGQKVDLMIIYPNNGKFLLETISGIFNSGIPVIVMDNLIDSGMYTMFIYSDNYKIGKSAGEFVIDMLGEQKGNVIEVQSSGDSDLYYKRKQGFSDALKGHTNIKINNVMISDGTRVKAKEKLKKIYNSEPKANIIFAYSDEMAIGAWEGASLNRDNSKFIGIGGLPIKNQGLEAVNNGILDATFIYPTGAKEAVTYALKILNGEKVPKNLELPVVKVTKSNVKQFLEK
jgi:galactofuranose transport system substrate-binding protein